MNSLTKKTFVVIVIISFLASCKTTESKQLQISDDYRKELKGQTPIQAIDKANENYLWLGEILHSKENFYRYDAGTRFLYQNDSNYPAKAAKYFDSLGFTSSTKKDIESVQIREVSENWIQVLNLSKEQWVDAIKLEQFELINQTSEDNFDWKGFFASFAYCSLSHLKFEVTNSELEASFSLSGRMLCKKMANGDCVYNYGTCKGRKYTMKLSKNKCTSETENIEATEDVQSIIKSNWLLKCKK